MLTRTAHIYHIAQHGTRQHSAAQKMYTTYIAQHTAQHSTAQHSTALHSTSQHRNAPWPHDTAQHGTALHTTAHQRPAPHTEHRIRHTHRTRRTHRSWSRLFMCALLRGCPRCGSVRLMLRRHGSDSTSPRSVGLAARRSWPLAALQLLASLRRSWQLAPRRSAQLAPCRSLQLAVRRSSAGPSPLFSWPLTAALGQLFSWPRALSAALRLASHRRSHTMAPHRPLLVLCCALPPLLLVLSS